MKNIFKFFGIIILTLVLVYVFFAILCFIFTGTFIGSIVNNSTDPVPVLYFVAVLATTIGMFCSLDGTDFWN